MSTSSTSPSTSLFSFPPFLEAYEHTSFKFTEFVRRLLENLKADPADWSLVVSKREKACPVILKRGEKNTVKTVQAIEKIHALMRKHLGFVVDIQRKAIDTAVKKEYLDLLKLLKSSSVFASSSYLALTFENLEKLEKKIAKIGDCIAAKRELFLYWQVDTSKRLIAYRVSLKPPKRIVESTGFCRSCAKAAFVGCLSLFKGFNYPSMDKLLSEKKVFFPVVRSGDGKQEDFFQLQTGIYIKQVLWRFMCRHSKLIASSDARNLSEVNIESFSFALRFLLHPKKYLITLESVNSLWEIAAKFQIKKIKMLCLACLKDAINLYKTSNSGLQAFTFRQAVDWHSEMERYYPGKVAAFFAELIEQSRSSDEFSRVLHFLNLKQVGPKALRMPSTLDLQQEHYEKLKGLPTLRKLSLNDARITDETVALVACLNLTALHLGNASSLTENGFYQLARMTTLKGFSVERLPRNLTDTSLRFLSRLPLNRLHLQGSALITDEGFRTLKGRITELVIDSLPKVTSQALSTLTALPLRKLRLSEISKLNMEDLLLLASLSDLRSLELVDTAPSQMTDLTISTLGATCKQLTYLRLEGLGVTDRGMMVLDALPFLENLTLCRLSINCLGSLTHLKDLTHLGLLNCDKIGENSLRSLVKISSLRSLTLRSSILNESSLPSILSLTQLRNLDVAGCLGFSDLSRLKSCLPSTSQIKQIVIPIKNFEGIREPIPGVVIRGKAPAGKVDHAVFTDAQAWKDALNIKHRLPLDYFAWLLEKNAKFWLPQIVKELANRIGKKHDFVFEDFTQSLMLISWAVEVKSLELAQLVWSLVFTPELHNYLSRGVVNRDALETSLHGSVYRSSCVQTRQSPCPLEVFEFLFKIARANADNLERTILNSIEKLFRSEPDLVNFIKQCLEQYERLFDFSNLEEDIKDLFRLAVGLPPCPDSGDLNQFPSPLSGILGKLGVAKLLNRDMQKVTQSLIKALFVIDVKSCEARTISVKTIAQILDLIVFTQKYRLEELEEFFSLSLFKHLCAGKRPTTSSRANEIKAVIVKANLSTLNIFTKRMEVINQNILNWWIDELEKAGLKIVYK